MTQSDSDPVPAGLFRRLAAMFYDSMLLFGVLFVATGVFQAVNGFVTGQPSSLPPLEAEQVVHHVEPASGGIIYQLYLLLTIYCFFAWFWRRNGQTLGMQAWRLRVENTDGSSIGYAKSAVRMLAAIVSLACFGAGYWWLLFSKHKTTWHDQWSNSRVVLLPKP